MKWSVRIACISGIDVRVHATFAVALAYCASSLHGLHGLLGAGFGVLLTGSFLVCLALHELGRALTAQHFGMPVTEIVLTPMGGAARLSPEPRKPQHELWTALAGPAVSAALVAVLWLTLVFNRVPLDLSDLSRWPEPSGAGLVRALFWSNLVLLAFDMLPALPMDGGRVFRALLSLAVGRSRGTRIASGAGQVIAICLLAVAIKKDWPVLALLGLIVFLGAVRERAAGRAGELLSELRAGEVCDPNAVVFGPQDPIGHVLDTLVRCPQAHFAVFYGKELLGTVARDQVLAHAPRVGLSAPLSSLMRREFFAVDAGTPLDEVRQRLLERAGRPVVVRSPTGYAGVLGVEDLRRITLVAERLAHAGIRRPQPIPDPALH